MEFFNIFSNKVGIYTFSLSQTSKDKFIWLCRGEKRCTKVNLFVKPWRAKVCVSKV